MAESVAGSAVDAPVESDRTSIEIGRESTAEAGGAELRRRLLPGRFEPLTDPPGWRCLGCRTVVRADGRPDGAHYADAVNRLAESAADHALYCGRCED